jgi:hypothetical protein
VRDASALARDKDHRQKPALGLPVTASGAPVAARTHPPAATAAA